MAKKYPTQAVQIVDDENNIVNSFGGGGGGSGGEVEGTAASGASDSDNPVKTGGRYNSTQPTFTDGQRGDTQIDTRGNTKTTIYGANTNAGAPVNTSVNDAAANAVNGLQTYARLQAFNGTEWFRVPGTVTGGLLVTPAMASGGNISVDTAATGTNFATFGSQACKQLTIVNDTGTDIEVRQGGSGVALPIFNGDKFTFYGLSNANTLGVRRKDTSNTQVTVKARWEA